MLVGGDTGGFDPAVVASCGGPVRGFVAVGVVGVVGEGVMASTLLGI